MEYRTLPRTGWKVSIISYGCMSLGSDHNENEQLLHKAIDLGINLFDTADLYDKGENEISVGKALASKRSSVFIATKVGNQMRADGSGWDWNPSKQYILRAVEASLKRLQTDYIDLYQLHGGTIDDPIDETIEAFEQLQQQGKIRAYGISSIRPNVIRAYVARSNIVSVMMQYSLLDRRPEEFCLDFLASHEIGVLVRGAVAKGLLVDKTVTEYLGYSEEQVATAREMIEQLSDRERTPAQTAIGYALEGPAVYSVAAGMRTKGQLMENTGFAKSRGLTDDEYQTIKAKLQPNHYQAHR